MAERYLHNVLDVLRDEIRAGTPVVGIEPSCLAVFKEELVKLLPHDDDAQRLAQQAFHFPDFFAHFDIEPPRLDGHALVWGHCHHKATGGMDGELGLLRAMGLEVETVQAGCCGLAGSWGFEEGHHELSMKIAEEGLLPKVREAASDTVVVADGFSCKTQIEEGSSRRALHVAEVMSLAREHGRGALGSAPRADDYAAMPPPRKRRRGRRS